MEGGAQASKTPGEWCVDQGQIHAQCWSTQKLSIDYVLWPPPTSHSWHYSKDIFFISLSLFNRERTPPRPQGQRPEPENRGVSLHTECALRNMLLVLDMLVYFFFLFFLLSGVSDWVAHLHDETVTLEKVRVLSPFRKVPISHWDLLCDERVGTEISLENDD